MSRDIIASIDHQALCHNLNRIKTLAPNSAILAMIKSNGYGHGLLRVAKALSDADAYGVACLEEALALRAVEPHKPIVIMAGFLDQTELDAYLEHNFTAVIHTPRQVELLQKKTVKNALNVWFKVNTGMNRLGFDKEVMPQFYEKLLKCEAVAKPIGLMTHLADADNIDQNFSKKQIQDFFQITRQYAGPKSIANSAGILSLANSHQDWVRPGIMLYGASPFATQTGAELDLIPAMTLGAKLIAVNRVKKGDQIGYGGISQAQEDMCLGVVASGYGDGYPRHARAGTPTVVKGKVCPLVGRVSMDLLTVDLRDCPEAEIGDRVILWGPELPIETVASYADTIGYELFCGVTSRVKFIDKVNLHE